jgi:ATP-binding cassette subfamily B protein
MSPARRLVAYALRYRGAFVAGGVCVVLNTGFQLAAPWLLKLAVDDLSAEVTISNVRLYGAGLFALAAVSGVFRFLMRRILIGASREFEYDLRNDFFAHLQRMHLGYFQHTRTGDLMSRATSDLGAVRMLIGPAVMYTATTGMTFIVGIVLLLSIHPRLTLLALIPLPLVSLSVWYFGDAIHRRFEKIQEQLSDISAITQEASSALIATSIPRA